MDYNKDKRSPESFNTLRGTSTEAVSLACRDIAMGTANTVEYLSSTDTKAYRQGGDVRMILRAC